MGIPQAVNYISTQDFNVNDSNMIFEEAQGIQLKI